MKRKIKSFNEFKSQLETDEKMQEEFKADPVDAVKNFTAANPLSSDNWVYRITVLSLGVVIILLVVGVIILVGLGVIKDDEHVPTILTAIGSAAIGALAGLLRPPVQQDSE